VRRGFPPGGLLGILPRNPHHAGILRTGVAWHSVRMAIVTRKGLRGRRRLSATAERLLMHLVGIAPVDSAAALRESGIPAARAWSALVQLQERGYIRATGHGDEPPVLHVTAGGFQHASQMAGRAA
jgi:hypothetical protein